MDTAVSGSPRVMLRAEGLAISIAAVVRLPGNRRVVEALGLGLKLSSEFKNTHLGTSGRVARGTISP